MTNETIEKDEAQIQFELDNLLDKIKKCILEKNDWIERNEICDILQLPKNTRLVEGRSNSKIGQLLYHYIRKKDLTTKKSELDPEDNYQYEIWVGANIPIEKLEEMLKSRHEYYNIAEPKKSGKKSEDKTGKNGGQTLGLFRGPCRPPSTTTEEEEDGDNEYLDQITNLILKRENLFITGYAGTGKSYILNKLKRDLKLT